MEVRHTPYCIVRRHRPRVERGRPQALSLTSTIHPLTRVPGLHSFDGTYDPILVPSSDQALEGSAAEAVACKFIDIRAALACSTVLKAPATCEASDGSICLYICIYVCIYMYLCMCGYMLCISVCMSVCMYVLMYVRT